MKTTSYDGKQWKIEADHTTAAFATAFVTNGVARNEFVVKEGTPEEIDRFMAGKKCKLLYSWNIKVLTREVLNKGGFMKYRETATLQAEGIHGEGRKFSAEGADIGNDTTPIVDTARTRAKRNFKKYGIATYAAIAACVVFILVLLGKLVAYVRSN
jgi:hypothetical protein